MKNFLLRYLLHITLLVLFTCFCLYYASAQTATPTAPAEITIYPNPVENKLSINGSGIFKIVVTDILGNTIIVQNTPDSKNVIDMSKLKPGIYFLLVKCTNGKNVVKRLVKE